MVTNPSDTLNSRGSGRVKLALSGRDAGGVLEAVVIAQQPDIDVAALYFVEVDLIGVPRGQLGTTV